MIPKQCKTSVLRLLKQQKAEKILLITESNDSELYDTINNESTVSNLLLRSFQNITEQDLEAGWNVLIIYTPSLYIKKEFEAALSDLLHFANQSVIVLGPIYTDLNGNAKEAITGERYLFPTRFTAFDFTYETNLDNCGWQLYNFYTLNTQNAKKNKCQIDKIDYNNAAEARKKIGRKLNIVYALPHLNLTGGLKYMITHAKYLCSLGHNVYIMCVGAESAKPTWSTLTDEDITGEILVSSYDEARPFLAEKKIDVIVAGFYDQLDYISSLGIPVLYWEQGSEKLYGNWNSAFASNSNELESIRKIYNQPVTIAAVSPQVREILNARYSRTAPLLFTGVDNEFYKPLNEDFTKPQRDVPQILLVGTPLLKFKGFMIILQVLTKLWFSGKRFKVVWSSQNEFSIDTIFPLEIIVKPKQQKLAELYRTSDLFISGSVYESFPMPPMEAFASGTAVVSTDNGGIHVYAKPGENILLSDQGKFNDLYASVEFLIDHPESRLLLAKNAKKTALEFSVQKSMIMLEDILYSMTASKNIFISEMEAAAQSKNIFNLDNYSIEKIPGYETLKQMIDTGKGLEAAVSFNKQSALFSRLDVLQNICKDKTVIHVGCTDHIPLIKRKMQDNTWLHGLLTKSCKKVLGIDINKKAIHYVKQMGVDNVIYGDITMPNNKEINTDSWNYILFAEMIEHLSDPIGFLRSVSKNYGKNIGKFIVTVPNAFGLPFVQMALCGQERVNPDHKAWYTPYTLWKTLDSAGFTVEKLFTCAYENSYKYLKENEQLVLEKPLLQDTIVAIFSIKK